MTDNGTQAATVLIVEDNEDVATSLQMLLELSGYAVLVSRSGRQGIALAQTESPAAILLDLGLPDMSGHDVLRELRASPDTRPIRIIALTGTDLDETELPTGESFDHHLLKPPDVDELLRLLPHG
ncbi:MAG: response regulator [Myxococcota bacterium]